MIRQSKPLTPFYQARSMLTLEESGLVKMAATESASALVVTTPKDINEGTYSQHSHSKNPPKSPHHKSSGGQKSNDRGGRHAGKGAGRGGQPTGGPY